MNRLAWLRLSSLPVALSLCCCAATQEAPKETKTVEPVIKVATLDVETREPTKEETSTLGLKVEHRARGQVVTAVTKDGAAARSGLVAGDVIVALGGVEVFSQDDIADVLRVSSTEQKLEASILRATTKKEETLVIQLGAKTVNQPSVPSLAWDFAGLPHMDAAIARAEKEKQLILVGLSGAET